MPTADTSPLATALVALPLALALGLLARPAAAQMPPNPPVEVATPLVATVVDHDVFTGRFEAINRVELRARVSGYLDSVGFEDGQVVEEGQVLFVIDQRPFRAAVRRAEAALESANAGERLARLEQQRAVQLAERNVGTAQEVDRTQAELSQSLARVGEAEAELDQAELNLEFTTIRAPFAGRISATEVDPGNLVAGGAEGSTLLATLVQVSPIHFVFTASEADYLRYARFETGRGAPAPSAISPIPVAVRLMDETDFVHEGVLTFVANELDPNSGTILGRAVVDNPERFIRPGLFGRVRVPASAPYEALLLPDGAILADQARRIVMTVDDEGRVAPAPVEPGPMHRGMRVIRGGIGPATRVVVNGVQRAQPGQTVTAEPVTLELAGGGSAVTDPPAGGEGAAAAAGGSQD